MIIGIDPSIRSVGMAAVDDTEGDPFSIAGIILDAKASDKDYPERALRMVESVMRMIYVWYLPGRTTVICETPAHWNHSRGIDSEASESVQKLYWFVGALAASLQACDKVDRLYLVRPIEWKGTTPKPIMVRRSAAALAGAFDPEVIESLTHDTHEAVCLARWFQRKFQDGLYQGIDLKTRPDINMTVISHDKLENPTP